MFQQVILNFCKTAARRAKIKSFSNFEKSCYKHCASIPFSIPLKCRMHARSLTFVLAFELVHRLMPTGESLFQTSEPALSQFAIARNTRQGGRLWDNSCPIEQVRSTIGGARLSAYTKRFSGRMAAMWNYQNVPAAALWKSFCSPRLLRQHQLESCLSGVVVSVVDLPAAMKENTTNTSHLQQQSNILTKNGYSSYVYFQEKSICYGFRW